MPRLGVKNRGLVSQRLNRHAGEWVAFVDDKVVEHNESLNRLMKKIESKGFKGRASVFLVPRKDEGPYVLVVIKK